MDRTIPPDREERFTQLYRRYQPQVLAYARRRLPEPDAVEAVADAFVAAWLHLDSAPADPLPWLYRIARNTAANQWRRNSRRRRLQERVQAGFLVTAGPDPAVATEGMDVLASALSLLTEDDREVLRLAAWEGLETAELGQALGCSGGTARVRLHRARRRLARLLASEDHTDHATTTMHQMTTEVPR